MKETDKVDEHIRDAEEKLHKVEHPYDGDKKDPSPEDRASAREQQEVREQAALAPDDPQTSREELELDLMEKGESEEGERIRSSG